MKPAVGGISSVNVSSRLGYRNCRVLLYVQDNGIPDSRTLTLRLLRGQSRSRTPGNLHVHGFPARLRVSG